MNMRRHLEHERDRNRLLEGDSFVNIWQPLRDLFERGRPILGHDRFIAGAPDATGEDDAIVDAIVDEVHSFCPGCWKQVEFLGESGCSTCGLPLEATDAEQCGACLAKPPRIQRTRSAVAIRRCLISASTSGGGSL